MSLPTKCREFVPRRRYIDMYHRRQRRPHRSPAPSQAFARWLRPSRFSGRDEVRDRVPSCARAPRHAPHAARRDTRRSSTTAQPRPPQASSPATSSRDSLVQRACPRRTHPSHGRGPDPFTIERTRVRSWIASSDSGAASASGAG